jgi:hypothetical protein
MARCVQPSRWSSDGCEARSVCKRVLCATGVWSSIILISKQSLFEVSQNQRYTDPSGRVSHNSKHGKQARGIKKPNRQEFGDTRNSKPDSDSPHDYRVPARISRGRNEHDCESHAESTPSLLLEQKQIAHL